MAAAGAEGHTVPGGDADLCRRRRESFDTFEFTAIPGLNKMLVLELARCEYIQQRENIIALGNSGTGKTHVALALGLAACQKGFSVAFITAASLVNQLMEARDDRRLLKLQRDLQAVRLLIVDEIGYLPCRRPAAATCCSSWSDSDRHIEQSPPRHIERVRVTAEHHPLAGQLVRVVRRKRHEGAASPGDRGAWTAGASSCRPAMPSRPARSRPRRPGRSGSRRAGCGRWPPWSAVYAARHPPLRRPAMRRSRPSPQPQPLPLWDTFRPETHRQLVALWGDLLQRRLMADRGQAQRARKAPP